MTESNLLTFDLQPFTSSPFPVSLNGTLTRIGEEIQLSFSLATDLSLVHLPTSHSEIDHLPRRAERKVGLWEDTCFEVFLSAVGKENYWEFNLSPSGDWNAFSFTSYRQDMTEDERISQLSIHTKTESEKSHLDLSVSLPLTPLQLQDQPLEVALSAVIKQQQPLTENSYSYWALVHQRPDRPDFHMRSSFVLRV